MAKYKITSPSGETFEITAPDDATEEQVMQYAQRQFESINAQPQAQGEDYTSGVRGVLRKAELASRGFVEGAADVIGALPELAASGLRYAGVPGIPEEGYYPQKLKEGFYNVGETVSTPLNALYDFGPSSPQSSGEEFAYGAGRGTADAASFMVPAAAVSKFAQAGSLTQKVGQVAASQPLTQLASSFVAGGTSEATDSDLAGFAAGLAVPTVPAMVKGAARRSITPFASQLTPNEQRLAAAAEAHGIKLTPGQKTGSPTLRRTESFYAQAPFASKSQGDIYDAQRKAFNKAVLSRAGINADEATPDVIDNAFKSIGKEFDDLARISEITPDQKLIDDVLNIADESSRRASADVSKTIQSYKDDFVKMHQEMLKNNKVTIQGRDYQKLSSDLKKRARSATDPDTKIALNSMASKLDDALERSSGNPELAEAWRDVRNRYRNLIQVNEAASAGTAADRASGNIPYAGLRQAVRRSDKSGYGRGRGDLNELSRVGDFMYAQNIPDSGSPQRLYTQQLLTTGGLGAGGYGLYSGDPALAATLAAGSILGPRATQMIYNTPTAQRYLTNQAWQPSQSNWSVNLLGRILAAQQLGEATEAEPTGRLAQQLMGGQ